MPKSTRSPLFPDVNVWLALTYGRHVHHQIARTWFESLDFEAEVCFCRVTQVGLLRLLTTRAVMTADRVMSQDEAWNAYDSWLSDGRVAFLEEPHNLDAVFRSIARGGHPSPNAWADAYLAAFATILGLKFVTLDRAFEGKVEQLLVLRP